MVCEIGRANQISRGTPIRQKIRTELGKGTPVKTLHQTIMGRELDGNPTETVAAQLTSNCPLPNRYYENEIGPK